MSAAARRLLTVLVLALLAAAGLAFAFWPQPELVDFAAADRGPLRVTIDDEGETRVKDVYVVSAPVGGRVLRLGSEVGDRVVEGETVLATIRETEPAFLDARAREEAVARIAAAEAAARLAGTELARAEAELRFAQSELARNRRLVQHEVVSEQAIERAETEVRVREAARASMAATRQLRLAELAAARAALIGPASDAGSADCGCLEVRAPISGTVLQLHQKSENVVVAGAPLLELGDPGNLEVVVDLLSQDAVRARPGAPVLIEDWGGSEPLQGWVERVEPFGFTKVSALGIEEQRVNVIIDFVDPKAARQLGHGFRVITRIVEWQSEDALRVPLGALFRDGEAWAVFKLTDGRAALQQVKIGHQNEQHAELLEGLAAGDQVVLHPSDRIADGTRIEARDTAVAGP